MVDRSGGRACGVTLLPPTFGASLRRLRQGRGISREKLAFGAGVSVSYLTHLERGERERPTRTVVDGLIRYLGSVEALPRQDRRHLFELAGLVDTAVPTVAQLCADITPDMRRALALHEPYAAGYFDSRWNLLAANAAVGVIFPGLREEANILHWFFGHEFARRAVVDWERAVELSVAGLRGRIGRLQAGEHFAGLLEELGVYPEFRGLWERGDVTYFREHPHLRFRDLTTGECRGFDFQIYDVDNGGYPGWVQFFGARRPRE
ncbi:helix-turn-helix transcriptional regulator [Nocardia sp. NPDC005366]|uniref:helix-turn-helix domain-containing protein n=1 Tax=Nocardia sp. NPDC005366 TaxID=3156878 RepID=UPI0033AC2CA3